MNILFALALFTYASGTPASPRNDHGVEKLFYFPMHANTAEPVVIESSWDLSSLAKRDGQRILTIVKKRDEPADNFNKYLVRVKVVLRDKSEYQVDLRRNVKVGTNTYRLSEGRYEELRKAIRSLLPDDLRCWDTHTSSAKG